MRVRSTSVFDHNSQSQNSSDTNVSFDTKRFSYSGGKSLVERRLSKLSAVSLKLKSAQ